VPSPLVLDITGNIAYSRVLARKALRPLQPKQGNQTMTISEAIELLRKIQSDQNADLYVENPEETLATIQVVNRDGDRNQGTPYKAVEIS
jgi:hypothetical protein